VSKHGEYRTLDRVAMSQRTRPAVTVEQVAETFLSALFRGLDEGPLAARGGHR
jgi:hypothetical protein